MSHPALAGVDLSAPAWNGLRASRVGGGGGGDRRAVRRRSRSFFDKGATGAGFVRFRTTSQNYYEYDTKALAVGESNQGIVSEKSKWIHQKQTM